MDTKPVQVQNCFNILWST